MILFIKKNIEKILMALGFVLLILFKIYTQMNNIPTENNWASLIGVTLFYASFLPGLWLASNKIKEKRKILSIILKYFTIIVCIILVCLYFGFLIKLIIS